MTRLELFAAQPAQSVPQTLADLDPAVDLWAEHVEMFAVGHRSLDREHAVCGAPVLWPIAAAHLMRLCGRLCPLCWPQPEAPECRGDGTARHSGQPSTVPTVPHRS